MQKYNDWKCWSIVKQKHSWFFHRFDCQIFICRGLHFHRGACAVLLLIFCYCYCFWSFCCHFCLIHSTVFGLQLCHNVTAQRTTNNKMKVIKTSKNITSLINRFGIIYRIIKHFSNSATPTGFLLKK